MEKAGAALQSVRRVAAADDWSISIVDCAAGPNTPAFEESHQRYSIAAVVAGTFQYRTGAGSALLYPGAVMLGNAGVCFECGHDHGVGDRCVAFHFSPALFEEIAASVGGSGRYRFGAASLAAGADLAPELAEIGALAAGARDLAAGDMAIRLAERVIGAASGTAAKAARISARDERRIARALRHIERRVAEPIDLEALSSVAAMSKYHFLRTFRCVTGLTPYQHVLGRRLNRAALALRGPDEPIASVAYDAGFSDLSTFNRRFRAVFGQSPGEYRRR
jgi:AraC-like DNA-binding protein